MVNQTMVRFGLALSMLLTALRMNAAELKPETLTAWEQYVQGAEARMKTRLGPGQVFLWADEEPNRAARLRQGEIQVAPMAGHGSKTVPNGLIHDWIGAAFIPNASLQKLLDVVHDYGRFKEFYKPVVVDARLIERSGEEDRFAMLLLHKVLFVTAAMDAQYESRDFRLDDRRYYSISTSTRVQEIQNYGKPSQREMPPDQGSGYMWRLYCIARYEERDGGVYAELEAIGLTRDIPLSMRWVVKPVVTKLSRNSLLVSLSQTRDAVQSTSEISRAAAAPKGSQLRATGPSATGPSMRHNNAR